MAIHNVLLATSLKHLDIWPMIMKAEDKLKQIIASNGKENKNNIKYPPKKTNQEHFHPKQPCDIVHCGFTSQSCQHHQCNGKIFSGVKKKSPLFFPPFYDIRKGGL